MLTIYKIVLNLAYMIIWPYMAYKRLRGREEWSQRRALNPDSFLPSQSDSTTRQPKSILRLWGHASSMGEVRVLARLFTVLKEMQPELEYYISTYTKTGQRLARELFPDAKAVFYFPIDAYFPLKRFFRQFRPDGIIMVETEIWPYFLDFCRRLKIPLFLANGRVSEKSSGRYKRFRRSLTPLLSIYRKFAVQSKADAERMTTLGADPNRIVVLGNIKHDPDLTVDYSAKRKEVRRRFDLNEDRLFLIAASTRPGEEEIISRAIDRIAGREDKIVLLVAPRHLERLEDVKTVLDVNRFQYVLYSEIVSGKKKTASVILMDKMGLLADLFYGADLAFVGGTMGDLGGHNIMEPVLAGTPVVFGPSVYNVSEAAEKIGENRLGRMVADEEELAEVFRMFSEDRLDFERIVPGKSSACELSVTGKTAALIIEEFDR
ncbi:MAG: hypothetical protein GY841_20450 [FCB group bacterium]|nr:hypothetical protein [FCB group bacterium]